MSTVTQSIPVPLSGFGAMVDVSSMVGPKTVILTGTFRGAYVLYGSHDGSRFAPLLQFDAGGVEGVRRTFSGALAWVALKSLAEDAFGATASVSGDGVPGDNAFTGLGTLLPGASGPQTPVDLGTSNYQSDLNFILAGGLEGKLVVEGSSDAVRWNPIGQFSVDPSGPGLLGPSPAPEFAPLYTEDLVRYVRLNVLGQVVGGGLVVTAGGSKSGGGGGASETLAQTYQVGSAALDQTIALADARGGTLVIYAASPTFTGVNALEVDVTGGVGAGFLRQGGMVLGPQNVVVGLPGEVPVFTIVPGTGHSVFIGGPISASGFFSQYQVAVGSGLNFTGYMVGSVAIGKDLLSNGPSNLVLGQSNSAEGGYDVVIGDTCAALAPTSVVVGHQLQSNMGGVLVGAGITGDGAGPVLIGSVGHSYNNDEIMIGRNLNTPVNGSGRSAGTIGSVSDAGGGSVTIHSSDIPAGLANNQIVDIAGTTSYNGSYPVSNVTAGTFDIVATWVATEVGTYGVRAADGSNIYMGFGIAGAGGVGNADTYQVAVGTDISIYGVDSVVVGRTDIDGRVASPANYVVVVGSLSAALGDKGVAVGRQALSNGASAVVVGPTNTASDNFDVVVGSSLATPVNGSGVSSGTITSVSNAGGGSVTIHSSDIPAGLAAGQQVVLTGTVVYDGTYAAANVTAGTFDIVHAWSVTAAGSYLVKAADGYNVYVGVNIQGAAGTGKADTHQVAVGTDIAVLDSMVVAVGNSLALTGYNRGSVLVGSDLSVDGGPVGTGKNILIGLTNRGSGGDVVVVGAFSSTSGLGGVVVGDYSIGYAAGTVVVGYGSTAVGIMGVSVGDTTNAKNNYDVLLGPHLESPINGSGMASGTIDSVSDAGGGSVTIHSSDIPAGLAAGQSVTLAGTTTYDGSYTVANVTAGSFDVVAAWGATSVGTYNVGAMDGYNIYVGVHIVDNLLKGNAETHQVAIGTDIVVTGSRVVVIGASAGSSIGADSSVVIGASANVSHAYSQVYGAGATSTANNQVVFGLSGGSSPGSCAIHELVVRGYNGGNLNTLDAIDHPVDSGNPDLAVSGLTVVVIQSAVVTNKTLKAAPLASLPGGALVAYLE